MPNRPTAPRTEPPTTPATLLLDASVRPSAPLPLNAVLTHTDYAASAKPSPERPLNDADLAVVALDDKPRPATGGRTISAPRCGASALIVATSHRKLYHR